MANSLHWFRKGLRIHDNQPLRDAIQGSSTFRAVFFLDRATVRNAKVSVNRWRFLLECLRDLDNSLKKFGSRLYIVQGHPIDVLPKLIKEWGITRLTFEYDSEPFPSQRDQAVRRLAENDGIEVLVKTSHSLFDISKFVEKNNGQAPITFKQFHSLLKDVGLPEPCVEMVDKDSFGSCVMPIEDDHDQKYGIPSFTELGLPLDEEQGLGVWKGGETQALHLLQLAIKQILESDKRKSKHSEDDSPFPKTTKLSPYLRFGCISPRLVFHEMTKLASKVQDPAPCVAIQKSLLSREFFFVMASKNPALDKMYENVMCLKFPWDKDNIALERWKEGKTGFPWIDAIMRQLKQEGWVHHIAREAVGCFLTRGCLWVSWEEGFKVFEEMQLDAEWSLNASCWMWLSCSAFFISSPSPWYCPVNFGKQLDPVGKYVRKYVPEVKNLPSEYVFEPWLAPADVQQKAGCIIGVNYPKNILDHNAARKICSSRMREVYGRLVVKVSNAPGLGNNVVHWFRKDLRLHDNPALWEALPNCRTFYAVYIFDPVNIKAAKVSGNRWNFLLQCLRDLDNNLKKCGTRLHVLRGQPTTIFPQLFREWNINKLTLESECEPFGQQRDEAIASLAEEFGVEMSSVSSHTLYNIKKILEMNGGKCPTLFKEFESIIRKLGPPDNPVESVTRKSFSSCICPISNTHEERYGVPKLNELNISEDQVTCGDLWVGGETEALTRLAELEEKILIGTHKRSPESASALIPSRTQLSPYLRFGCLSPKTYYKRLTIAYMKMKCKPPPMSLYCHLVWREFFFTLASKNPNMDSIENNPLCLAIEWEKNEEALKRWKEGQTGFPWIDAIMRQLRQEGWIHHIARQAVGCFLTRGCLWISWEEGFKVFEELQLDAEWSVNSGSWIWISCSAFFHSQIPWFCPVSVGKKLDPSGNYIRKYIPELRTVPNKYIYHPWTAPEGIQKASNCVIGKHYPEPIADYVERRKICLERLKEVCCQMETATPSTTDT